MILKKERTCASSGGILYTNTNANCAMPQVNQRLKRTRTQIQPKRKIALHIPEALPAVRSSVPSHASVPNLLLALFFLAGIGQVHSLGSIINSPSPLASDMSRMGFASYLRPIQLSRSKIPLKGATICPLRNTFTFQIKGHSTISTRSPRFVTNDPHNFICLNSPATESSVNFSFPSNSIYTQRTISEIINDGVQSTSTCSTQSSHAENEHTNTDANDNAIAQESSIDTTIASQYETLFSLDLPEGKCVGLKLTNPKQAPTVPTSLDPKQIQSNENHWIKQILHPDEVKYGSELSFEAQRMTFFIGRLAMRTALEQMKVNGIDIDSHASVECEDERLGGFTNTETRLPSVSTRDQSILKDEHGRPQVPNGFMGSISHKQTTGVALVSTLPVPADDGAGSGSEAQTRPTIGIGVDIEQSFSRRKSVAKRILTPNELEDLGGLDGVTRDEEVLLRFSLKECVYKAMHPLICQFVGFQEAEIKPHNDGTATVSLNLKSGQHHRFKEVRAHWRQIEGDYFLTTSRVTLKEKDS
jgi:phosphopantetheine--protein transferase-like protein